MYGRPAPARTAFAVERAAQAPVETLAGGRHAWRFRPHFHAGDEVVRMLAGRALLRLPDGCREVVAGETVVVPAGTLHRFEPLDRHGWAFASRFVPSAVTAPSGGPLAAQARALLGERTSLHTDVEAVAAACAVSAGYLARAFRRETGTSLHRFHVLLALHAAKARLRQRVSIAEAALDAGFYDQAHLNREFVRTYGMTPASFRDGWNA